MKYTMYYKTILINIIFLHLFMIYKYNRNEMALCVHIYFLFL